MVRNPIPGTPASERHPNNNDVEIDSSKVGHPSEEGTKDSGLQPQDLELDSSEYCHLQLGFQCNGTKHNSLNIYEVRRDTTLLSLGDCECMLPPATPELL